MCWINLQLFGGRGGGSGMGGGALSPTERALQQWANGTIADFETLSLSDQQLIVDYMKDFLRENQGNGYVESGYGYISRDEMSGFESVLDDIASRGFLDENEGETVWVTYTDSGSKSRLYHPGDDSITEKDLKKLYKDYRSGKIKGIMYEDSGGTVIGGKGFVPLTSDESGSSYLTFGPGKMNWKKTK